MLLKTCAGLGAFIPSVQIARNGENGAFKWKVIDRLSDETVDEVIRLKPVVLIGVNLPPVQNVQVFRSALIPPLAAVGSSVTMPGVIAPFALPRKSGA